MALVGAMTSGLIFGSIEFARCPQLVAFVPTQQFASRQIPVSAVGDARFVDASYGVNRRNGGAFATDVVARMPEAGRGVSISKAHGKDASRARLMKAELPNAPMARQEQIVQPQFILLTAWEQVEGPGRWTANREAGLRRDYDPEPTADEEYLPESNEGGRGVMTRLILKVYPVGVDSANPDLNSPNPFLPTDRPAMIPVRDGWFVFQL